MPSSRMKRWGWTALVVVGCIAAVVFIDAERRRRQDDESTLLQGVKGTEAVGSEALAKRLEDPAQFRSFCELLDSRYRAMNDRYKSLQHHSRQRIKRLDESENVIADEEIDEIVDFPNQKERRRRLSQKDMLTGKSIDEESTMQKLLNAFRAPFQYPFLPDSTWDDFNYRFAGVEALDGKQVVKVEFTPNPPFGRKLIGTIWADAESGQPVRFAGKWHKPTGLTHRFEAVVTYGPSENGHPQLRRIETRSAGGSLLVIHRYAIAYDIDDYRTPEAK